MPPWLRTGHTRLATNRHGRSSNDAGRGKEPGPDTLTHARQRRADQRAVDQDRTLAAMHQLEAALAAAAPRREQAWSNEVRRALGILGQAARQEAENAARTAPGPGRSPW